MQGTGGGDNSTHEQVRSCSCSVSPKWDLTQRCQHILCSVPNFKKLKQDNDLSIVGDMH